MPIHYRVPEDYNALFGITPPDIQHRVQNMCERAKRIKDERRPNFGRVATAQKLESRNCCLNSLETVIEAVNKI